LTISFLTARPDDNDLTAITTSAPLKASTRTVSDPIPPFAPCRQHIFCNYLFMTSLTHTLSLSTHIHIQSQCSPFNAMLIDEILEYQESPLNSTISTYACIIFGSVGHNWPPGC
jgi:hypothetical protein